MTYRVCKSNGTEIKRASLSEHYRLRCVERNRQLSSTACDVNNFSIMHTIRRRSGYSQREGDSALRFGEGLRPCHPTLGEGRPRGELAWRFALWLRLSSMGSNQINLCTLNCSYLYLVPPNVLRGLWQHPVLSPPRFPARFRSLSEHPSIVNSALPVPFDGR